MHGDKGLMPAYHGDVRQNNTRGLIDFRDCKVQLSVQLHMPQPDTHGLEGCQLLSYWEICKHVQLCTWRDPNWVEKHTPVEPRLTAWFAGPHHRTRACI